MPAHRSPRHCSVNSSRGSSFSVLRYLLFFASLSTALAAAFVAVLLRFVFCFCLLSCVLHLYCFFFFVFHLNTFSCSASYRYILRPFPTTLFISFLVSRRAFFSLSFFVSGWNYLIARKRERERKERA